MRKITLPVLTPKKTLSGDLLKKTVQKAREADSLKPFDANDIVYTIPAGAETDNGTNGLSSKLNPTQEQDAALVAKLPSGFPIQEWDSMSTKAQRQAMKFSGLAEPEQWRLLNPSAPLGVLDAANRERYRPVTTTGADEDSEILTNPSKTPYLQNGESDGELDISKGFPDANTPKKPIGRKDTLKFITEYPAIAQFVDVGHVTSEQLVVLSDAQYKLAALSAKGKPTQQEIDDILADTCTKMLTDENRPKNDKGDEQIYIPAYTEAVGDFFQRLRVDGEAKAAELKWKVAGHKNIFGLMDSYARHEAEVYIQNFILDNLEKGVLNLRDMGTWNDLITDYSPEAYALNGSQYLFVYNGMILSVEDLGNIAYGYRGSAMGISRFALLVGGDVAGIVKDILSGSSQVSKDSVYTIGDDQRDKASIELGIQLYKDGK
ncbi:hypothetical protein SDC9_49719 [bioreactor metagenome]|uniref:Bacterial toxin 44 domain-containing protein n=1 Tax=bioreactor metagenome TaxID=1076179 RepID=A0A644WI57_9ZZZZ